MVLQYSDQTIDNRLDPGWKLCHLRSLRHYCAIEEFVTGAVFDTTQLGFRHAVGRACLDQGPIPVRHRDSAVPIAAVVPNLQVPNKAPGAEQAVVYDAWSSTIKLGLVTLQFSSVL
jgi:hypothetical protein